MTEVSDDGPGVDRDLLLPSPVDILEVGSDLFGRQSLCRQGQYDLVDPL
jgi:hypothetical protein